MNIREKLMQVQSNLKAPKNRRNSFGNYNYRSAEDILESVKPHLASVGLTQVISDEIVEVGGRIYVKATVSLLDTENDEVITVSAFAREAENKKGMDDSQITGSTSSYARKYALNGMYAIDDVQDADSMDNRQKSAPSTSNTAKSSGRPTSRKPAPKKSEITRDEVFENAYQKGIEKSEVIQIWKGIFGDKADTTNSKQVITMLAEIEKISEFGGTPFEEEK